MQCSYVGIFKNLNKNSLIFGRKGGWPFCAHIALSPTLTGRRQHSINLHTKNFSSQPSAILTDHKQKASY